MFFIGSKPRLKRPREEDCRQIEGDPFLWQSIWRLKLQFAVCLPVRVCGRPFPAVRHCATFTDTDGNFRWQQFIVPAETTAKLFAQHRRICLIVYGFVHFLRFST